MKSEMKQTPGPWRVLPEEVDRSYIRIRGTSLGDRYKIANVLTPVYDNAPEREAEQTRANARLIAAAPELLDALVACLRVLAVLGHSENTQVQKAARAIAKATGATP